MWVNFLDAYRCGHICLPLIGLVLQMWHRLPSVDSFMEQQISRFQSETGMEQLKIALNMFDADWNLLLRNCPPEGKRTMNLKQQMLTADRFTSIF